MRKLLLLVVVTIIASVPALAQEETVVIEPGEIGVVFDIASEND